jgi:hypothetical protein
VTEDLRAQLSRAQAPVLSAIVASTATRVVAMGGLLSLFPPSMPTSIQGVACVTDGADTLMYRDCDAPPVVARRLVDGHVAAMSS